MSLKFPVHVLDLVFGFLDYYNLIETESKLLQYFWLVGFMVVKMVLL